MPDATDVIDALIAGTEAGCIQWHADTLLRTRYTIQGECLFVLGPPIGEAAPTFAIRCGGTWSQRFYGADVDRLAAVLDQTDPFARLSSADVLDVALGCLGAGRSRTCPPTETTCGGNHVVHRLSPRRRSGMMAQNTKRRGEDPDRRRRSEQ